MDVRLEISGNRVTCVQPGQRDRTVAVSDFVEALGTRADVTALPESAVIPDGVRFVRRRGNVTVLVLEAAPNVRTVRWLKESSGVAFGDGAMYETVRLAFPYVVVAIAFKDGRLTGYNECFYRVDPIHGLDDPLLFPNLYNVAANYALPCWICLVNLREDLGPLPWPAKIQTVWEHIWGGAWNRSSEVHEGMSYWQSMRDVDKRVSTLKAWQDNSARDPLFPLNVKWRPAGRTVGQVVDGLLKLANPCAAVSSAAEIAAAMIHVRKQGHGGGWLRLFRD